ncbi:MAG: hypothetical protein J0L99_09730 [Chitinophagales bacterium]|nr:hypothetical protein [Chitinophagales bacterium]
MIVYLNSTDFAHSIYTRHLRADGLIASDVRVIQIDRGISVADMARAVINNARTGHPIAERSIYRLIINSHGSPGSIAIGNGINVNNVNDLAPLRPYFTPLSQGGHGVLIDACLVAGGSSTSGPLVYGSDDNACEQEPRFRYIGSMVCEPRAGYGFMMEMARVLDTKITAGFNIQFGPNGRDAGGLEGNYIRVFPNGLTQIIERQYVF